MSSSAPSLQRQRALEHANQIRLDRADLRRRIAHKEVSLAAVLLDPPTEALGWAIGDALIVQWHWGRDRTRRLLGRLNISPMKLIGEMTERQRQQIARAIS